MKAVHLVVIATVAIHGCRHDTPDQRQCFDSMPKIRAIDMKLADNISRLINMKADGRDTVIAVRGANGTSATAFVDFNASIEQSRNIFLPLAVAYSSGTENGICVALQPTLKETQFMLSSLKRLRDESTLTWRLYRAMLVEMREQIEIEIEILARVEHMYGGRKPALPTAISGERR